MKKATETPHPGSSDTGVTGVTENGHQDAAVRISASRPRAKPPDTSLHSPKPGLGWTRLATGDGWEIADGIGFRWVLDAAYDPSKPWPPVHLAWSAEALGDALRIQARPMPAGTALPGSIDAPLTPGMARFLDRSAPGGCFDATPEMAERLGLTREPGDGGRLFFNLNQPEPPPAAGPWIAVTEQMPDDGRDVLVFEAPDRLDVGFVRRSDGQHKPCAPFWQCGGSFGVPITHWAELRPTTGGKR